MKHGRWGAQHALAGSVIAAVMVMPWRLAWSSDAVHLAGAGLGLAWYAWRGHRWVEAVRRAPGSSAPHAGR